MRSLMPNKMPRDLSDRIQWLNSSGETVPAYGVVRLFSYDDATNQFQADKPDGSSGVYYPNGGVSTAGDEYSASPIWNMPRRCLVDSLSYAVGDTVGPVAGKWGMSSAGSGFKIFRPPNADKVAVVQMEGNGGNSGIIPGIVSEDLGKGYYTVELAEWGGETPECDEDGPSGAAEDCDPCKPSNVSTFNASLSGSLELGCGGDANVPSFKRQHIGTGVYVLAYDPASVLVPLELNTDCVVADTGASNSLIGSGANSSDQEPVWHVVRGYQTHTVQYREEKECCNGELVVTRRQAIFFAARVCEVQICSECDQT